MLALSKNVTIWWVLHLPKTQKVISFRLPDWGRKWSRVSGHRTHRQWYWHTYCICQKISKFPTRKMHIGMKLDWISQILLATNSTCYILLLPLWNWIVSKTVYGYFFNHSFKQSYFPNHDPTIVRQLPWENFACVQVKHCYFYLKLTSTLSLWLAKTFKRFVIYLSYL